MEVLSNHRTRSSLAASRPAVPPCFEAGPLLENRDAKSSHVIGRRQGALATLSHILKRRSNRLFRARNVSTRAVLAAWRSFA